jgi:hypothetical protein
MHAGWLVAVMMNLDMLGGTSGTGAATIGGILTDCFLLRGNVR